MMRALAFSFALAASPLAAQQASTASGGQIRALDKINGQLENIEIATGQTASFGLIDITMNECRYPSGNPSGDAYMLLTIHYNNEPDPVFQGWMIASAPALNPLDHPRYDVWALRCKTS